MRPPPAQVWTVALVLLWPLAVYSPAVLAGAVLAPGDGLGYYMPLRAIAAEAWRVGEVPFWNPWHFAGMPLLAALQAGVFFPGNLFFLFMPLAAAMNASLLGAYMLAGAGAWAYVRALGLPAASAVLAGLVFTGSGALVANLEHLSVVQAAALIPWLFWAAERFFASGRARYALAFALALTLQIFAGYPQTVAIAGLMLAPYALVRAWPLGPAEGLARLGQLGLAAGLGVALGAIQLLPAAELLAGSARGRMTFAELTANALPVRELVTLAFPFLFGSEPGEVFRVPAWGAGPWRNELVGYAGVATLMLAALALASALREAVARYWLAVAGLATLLALGAQTPLYKLWAMLPVLKLMRVPGRHLLELDLALAVLAGLGLAWLLNAHKDDRPRAAALAAAAVAVPVGLVLLALAVGRGWLATRWQGFAPPGVDVAAALAPTQPAVWLPLLLALVAAAALVALARDPRPARQALLVALVALDLGFFAWHQGWRAALPQRDGPYARPVLSDAPRTLALALNGYPYHDLALVHALRHPQTGALLGARLVNGYEPMAPAGFTRQAGLVPMGGQVAGPELLRLEHHVLDILNGRTVRIDQALYAYARWADPIASHPRWERLPDQGPALVYTNHRALPRAWRPTRLLVRRASEIGFMLRHDADFDPRRVALVETPLPPGPAWTPGEVWTRTLSPNRIRVRTRGTGPGLVVVSEAWDPGWSAWLGSRRVPVHKVDGLVLGVEVPSGEQAFELRYRPPSWERALAVSGAAAVVLLGWALVALAGVFVRPVGLRRP